MSSPQSDIVEFGAKVQRADYDEFKQNFPQYGAVNWFINTSLRSFNEAVKEAGADGLAMVNIAVKQMLEQNKAQSGDGDGLVNVRCERHLAEALGLHITP